MFHIFLEITPIHASTKSEFNYRGIFCVQIKSRTSHVKNFAPSQHQPVTALTTPKGFVNLRDVI